MNGAREFPTVSGKNLLVCLSASLESLLDAQKLTSFSRPAIEHDGELAAKLLHPNDRCSFDDLEVLLRIETCFPDTENLLRGTGPAGFSAHSEDLSVVPFDVNAKRKGGC